LHQLKQLKTDKIDANASKTDYKNLKSCFHHWLVFPNVKIMLTGTGHNKSYFFQRNL